MVVFLGPRRTGGTRLFLVSDDVSRGERRRALRATAPDNCQLLKLKVGDEAELDYAPEDDLTYKLKLLGIRAARSTRRRAASRAQARFASGVRAIQGAGARRRRLPRR